MSVNYVLIFAIILIAAAMVMGYYLGTVRMIYIGIVLSVSIFLAVMVDSGVYKVLDLTGIDNAIYNNKNTAVFYELANEAEYTLDELDSSIIAQTTYIEGLSVPKYIRLSLLENNNSKVYELFQINSFHEYIDVFFGYTIVCLISFLVSLLLTLGGVAIICRIIGISHYIAAEKKSGKVGGVALGFVFGITILYIILAFILLVMDTKFGMALHGYVKSSHIMNYMYENNIIINVFMGVKIPIWIAGKR